MDKKPKKPNTGKGKAKIKDLEVKDAGKVKGGAASTSRTDFLKNK